MLLLLQQQNREEQSPNFPAQPSQGQGQERETLCGRETLLFLLH